MSLKHQPIETAHSILLDYQPPYAWDRLIDFLAFRSIDGVEAVDQGVYWRTVREETASGQSLTGWIRVENHPGQSSLQLTVPESLSPVLPQIVTKVRKMFDLDSDPQAIYQHLESMNQIQPGLCQPGTRIPGSYDPFEMCVRAVLGQQITVKAARTLALRLTASLGTSLETGIPGLTHLFPPAASLLDLGHQVEDQLGVLGVTSQRSASIRSLAGWLVSESGDLTEPAAVGARMDKWLAIKGIGPWTAQYLAMRILNWPDAFPSTDYGVRKTLEPMTQKEIDQLAESWRPWRAYATINIWNYR